MDFNISKGKIGQNLISQRSRVFTKLRNKYKGLKTAGSGRKCVYCREGLVEQGEVGMGKVAENDLVVATDMFDDVNDVKELVVGTAKSPNSSSRSRIELG